MRDFVDDLKLFTVELYRFTLKVLNIQFIRFDNSKDKFVTRLYRQRGKMSKRLIHVGMSALAVFGIVIGPYIAKEFPGISVNPWSISSPQEVLSASTTNQNTSTNISPNR